MTMSSLNPFLDDQDDLSTSVINASFSATQQPAESHEYSLDNIAEELIKNKFILTALELYTEIQERGKDMHRLRSYFSNPSNFDLPVGLKDGAVIGGLNRTSSTSTFDSLDMTHFSDEGQVDEKIAVLEFELRKAKDTIKSLRANLTETAEQQSLCLLENGLLLNGKNASEKHEESADDVIKPLEMRAINYLVNEYLLNHGYKLSSITFSDENADQDFEDWDDVGINTSKPPGLLKLYRDYSNHVIPKLQTSNMSTSTEDLKNENTELQNALKQLEVYQKEVECLKNENIVLNQDLVELQTQLENIKEIQTISNAHVESSSVVASIRPLENAEQTSGTPTNIPPESRKVLSCDSHYEPEPGRMSKPLWEAMLNEMQSSIEESWLKDEVLKVSESAEDLVLLLGRCLPHIVPTVLLAKRDQLVPLLLGTTALHPDAKICNDLLHILFNLIKRPDASQRQIILHGCTGYAGHVGCHRAEEELLPQFWEQLGHKYPERRQLIAEACGVIAPYLRAEMRGSLLISILLQMLQEEKLEAVKCSLVKSLASVYAFVDDDDDKYSQAFQLFSSFLNDNGGLVRDAALLHLLPSIAVWSLDRNALHSHLCNELIKVLEQVVCNLKEDSAIQEVVPILYLLPYLFVAVLLEIEDKIDENDYPVKRDFSYKKRKVEDPSVIIGDDALFRRKITAFDALMSKSDPNKKVLIWITSQFLPRLLNMFVSVNPDFVDAVTSFVDLMELFCKLFGKIYVEKKVAKQFKDVFENSSEHLSTSLLSVYVTSILPLLENDRDLIKDFLLESTVKLSVGQFSIDNVKLALILLRYKPHYHDVIIQLLWSLVMNESPLVRSNVASLLVVMTTDDVDGRIVSNRVFPALITLSTDDKTIVRISTVTAFCFAMANPSVDSELVERAIAQLTEVVASNIESSYDEQSQDGTLLGLHSVRCNLVDLVARIGAVLHPKFRDEFILPHLVAIAASNNQNTDISKRSILSLSLLEAYICLSCCFISPSLLKGSVLPALKCLVNDIEPLHTKKLDELNALITEVEQKLDQGGTSLDESMDQVKNDNPTKQRFLNRLF